MKPEIKKKHRLIVDYLDCRIGNLWELHPLEDAEGWAAIEEFSLAEVSEEEWPAIVAARAELMLDTTPIPIEEAKAHLKESQRAALSAVRIRREMINQRQKQE